jgi:hypothetical protein
MQTHVSRSELPPCAIRAQPLTKTARVSCGRLPIQVAHQDGQGKNVPEGPIRVVQVAGGAEYTAITRTYVLGLESLRASLVPRRHDPGWTPDPQSNICPADSRFWAKIAAVFGVGPATNERG